MNDNIAQESHTSQEPHKVFYVDVGDISVDQVKQLLESAKQAFQDQTIEKQTPAN